MLKGVLLLGHGAVIMEITIPLCSSKFIINNILKHSKQHAEN